MRLWTLHPKYLDPKGLVAAWREALLAQKVLANGTNGYRNHPQLARFRSRPEPVRLIAAFLAGIADEAGKRGYHFDTTKIAKRQFAGHLTETSGQLLYEWNHLLGKLRMRSPERLQELLEIATPEAHPLFRIVPGEINDWEKR